MSLIEKIKLLFKIKDPALKLIDGVKQFKSGYKTVTFWMTLLSGVLTLVGALKGFIPPEAALVVTVVLTAFYNFIRGFEKMDQNALRPMIRSTEFWAGVLGLVSTAIVNIQTGGVNPAWLVSMQSAIAAAMAGAQALGNQMPKDQSTS